MKSFGPTDWPTLLTASQAQSQGRTSKVIFLGWAALAYAWPGREACGTD